MFDKVRGIIYFKEIQDQSASFIRLILKILNPTIFFSEFDCRNKNLARRTLKSEV